MCLQLKNHVSMLNSKTGLENIIVGGIIGSVIGNKISDNHGMNYGALGSLVAMDQTKIINHVNI